MGHENKFLCPECGADCAGIVSMVSAGFDSEDPLSGVLQWISCEKCKTNIPAHLAELWDGLTEEGAKKEWRKMYRELVLNSDDEFFTNP